MRPYDPYDLFYRYFRRTSTPLRSLACPSQRCWRMQSTILWAVRTAARPSSPLMAGLSPRGDPLHEAFLGDWVLPTRSAYAETCSNIANAMWNWRMLGITAQARYGDQMERVLYNSLLSAVSADGEQFEQPELPWEP